jgi:hypothetical protein
MVVRKMKISKLCYAVFFFLVYNKLYADFISVTRQYNNQISNAFCAKRYSLVDGRNGGGLFSFQKFKKAGLADSRLPA